MGHEDEGLYNHLLASLGERVVPLLIDRTRHSGEEKHNAIPERVAEALLLIARHQPDVVSGFAKRCLADGHAAMIELGATASNCLSELDRPRTGLGDLPQSCC